MAAKWRMNSGCDAGMPLRIQGHPWFKWIDSGIEQTQITDVINNLRVLYQKQQPEKQVIAKEEKSQTANLKSQTNKTKRTFTG